MKVDQIIYWVSTAIMCLIFAFSATMYLSKTEMVKEMFLNFGYPAYLVLPLAIMKILGIIAVLTKKSKFLTEWAYAGFLFDAVLGFFAHHMMGDGQGAIATVAIVATVISRIYYSRLYIAD